MAMTAKMPMMIQITHAGVLVLVIVSLLVFSSVLVLIFELSFMSDFSAVCASLAVVVCMLFCLPLRVCRVVFVVLTGCCVPVPSGALHVVSSITSSTSVLAVLMSDDCCEVCTSVCNSVCCSKSFFWSVCTDSAVCVAVLVVLQLTPHRAVSSMRTIVDFLNSARELAHIFT